MSVTAGSHAIDTLHALFRRIANVDHAMTFLGWDQMVMMPPAGVESRSAAIAELASVRHGLFNDPSLPALFDAASGHLHDDGMRADYREMRRVWLQETQVPEALMKARILAGARCEQAWRTQRAANDWQGFLGNFREVVDLSREEAQVRRDADPERLGTPYDALLDLHCSGDTSALIDSVFDRLREELPRLREQVQEKQATRANLSINGDYPIDRQIALNRALLEQLGFEFKAGRLDVSAHPFSTGVRGDLRITTRFKADNYADGMQATAHEVGHASYEGGLPEALEGLPVGRSRNMCIHESQSLMFEKHLLMSRGFCRQLGPMIAEHLPGTTPGDDALWQYWTRVQPSYIRVEADEITYPMHIMVRYDIERALINDGMDPADIPEAWNDGMQRYLGLSTEGNYTDGCLQDIHWTGGAFGYFPSYTLGAVNAAQLFATIRATHGDWQERLARGDVSFAREWLSQAIWQRGSALESQDLMMAATGNATSPDAFIAHLRARYLDESR